MMMRKLITTIIAGTTLLLGGVVFAQSENLDVMNLPKLNQFVTDFAGVLDQPTLAEMNQHAYQYEQSSGHQFVAIIIPDRQGKELFDIALKAFNDNAIGSKEKNDGLLLVIAANEKKIRIMVGYGLEAEMPDVLATDIIEEDIRPLVNAGDIAGAVKIFYARSEEAIEGGEAKSLESNDHTNITPLMLITNLLGFAFVMGYDISVGRRLKEARKHNKKIKSVTGSGVVWALLFIFHIGTVLLPWESYIIGPFIAGWVGAVFYGLIGGVASGRGFGGSTFGGGGGFSSGGGGGGGFSGGGGSSGGGGGGD